MNFERKPSTPKQPMVKITITTVDTNLEYEIERTHWEADVLINKLTHENFVNWIDTEDNTTHYINTRNIIGIDVEDI